MQHYTSRIRSAKLPTNRPALLRQGDSPEPPAAAQGGGACDPPGRVSFAECKGNCRCIYPADSDDGALATFIFRLWSDERPETLFANAVGHSDQRLGKCLSSGNLKNTGLSCYLPQVDFASATSVSCLPVLLEVRHTYQGWADCESHPNRFSALKAEYAVKQLSPQEKRLFFSS